MFGIDDGVDDVVFDPEIAPDSRTAASLSRFGSTSLRRQNRPGWWFDCRREELLLRLARCGSPRVHTQAIYVSNRGGGSQEQFVVRGCLVVAIGGLTFDYSEVGGRGHYCITFDTTLSLNVVECLELWMCRHDIIFVVDGQHGSMFGSQILVGVVSDFLGKPAFAKATRTLNKTTYILQQKCDSRIKMQRKCKHIHIPNNNHKKQFTVNTHVVL